MYKLIDEINKSDTYNLNSMSTKMLLVFSLESSRQLPVLKLLVVLTLSRLYSNPDSDLVSVFWFQFQFQFHFHYKFRFNCLINNNIMYFYASHVLMKSTSLIVPWFMLLLLLFLTVWRQIRDDFDSLLFGGRFGMILIPYCLEADSGWFWFLTVWWQIQDDFDSLLFGGRFGINLTLIWLYSTSI